MIIVCVSNPNATGGIQACFASIVVFIMKLEPTKVEKMPEKRPNLMFLKNEGFCQKLQK